VGGGCYGTFYARQLLEARSRGRASWQELIVVDRDPECRFTRELPASDRCRLERSEWDPFFDLWLAQPERRAAEPADVVVPSPLMPHLMYQWLLRRGRSRWPGREVETRPLDQPLGTPYDRLADDGTRYVSYADWLCPTHCVEPAICPVTRSPRTWEIREAMEGAVRRAGRNGPVAGPVVFQCRQQVHGVGAFTAGEVLAGDAMLEAVGATGEAVDLLVGTVSSCHGALNLLHVGPSRARLYSGPGGSEDRHG